ncbi:hypothetical protein GMORB2_6414, partial [Geosmithia morbida]
SHSLWYSSSRSPVYASPSNDTAFPNDPHHHQNGERGGHNGGGSGGHGRRRGQALERTALHRLAMDEFWMARRKHGVANFGSHWLKPPGIPKTLHQLLEERREQEEHQEAMRREQLAQELAEAEAEAAAAAAGGEGPDGEDGEMDDVQLDGAQDLDDDIPEAGDDYFMSNDEDDDGDDSDESDSDEQDSEDDEEEGGGGGEEEDDEAMREGRQNDLVAARMRMTDDAFREALVRGDPDGDDMYGGDEELHEQDQGHMLDEEDFGAYPMGEEDGDDAIDMDANLDDDIPEADEPGGYEHTDSGADLKDNDDDDDDDDDDVVGFAPRVAPLGPPQSPTLRGGGLNFGRGGQPRPSLDMSGFLSQDESSFMDSSPVQARRARHG